LIDHCSVLQRLESQRWAYGMSIRLSVVCRHSSKNFVMLTFSSTESKNRTFQETDSPIFDV